VGVEACILQEANEFDGFVCGDSSANSYGDLGTIRIHGSTSYLMLYASAALL
jgi:hypothetical protein